MANLYGAYKGASSAGVHYASTLQSIIEGGYEQEHSKQMFDIGQEQSDRAFAFGQQALGLLSTFAGAAADQEEAVADIERGAKANYESQFVEGESFTAWEDLAPDEKSKLAPVQTYGESKLGDFFRSAEKTEGRRGEGETRWGELGQKLGVLLGGKEREWELGGKTYKQSDILAKSKHSLYEELGIGDSCPSGQTKNKLTGLCE